VKDQGAERENWSCEKCRTEKVKMLQEELQNSLRQIVELKDRNKELQDKLLLLGAGKSFSVHAKQKVTKCMMVGD